MAVRFCPHCGHEVPTTARFCSKCASSLGSSPTPQSAITPPLLHVSTGIDRAAVNARRLWVPALAVATCVLAIALAVLTYKLGHPPAPRFPTGDKAAINPPINLVSTNVTATSVALSWTASPASDGIVAYDVYNGSTFAVSVPANTTTITGLSPNSSYTFTVAAKNSAGVTSPASNPVTVMTNNASVDSTPPTAPANLTSSDLKPTSVMLTWAASTDNVGVTAYDVYNGTVLLTSVTGMPPNTTATVSGLTPGTPYTFTVKAKDAAGNVSDASNEAVATTSTSVATDGDPSALLAAVAGVAAPTELSATNVTADSVDLTWTAPAGISGVTGYDVYNGTNLASTVTSTKASVANLTPGTSYTFTVKAKDAKGNASAASNAAIIMTRHS